jgi:hypothetical protein
VNNAYAPALKKAGIEGACWHTLRHTAASRRVMAGVNLTSVMAILGHRNIATTMRYSHLSPDHLREAVNLGSLGNRCTTSPTTMPTDLPVIHKEHDQAPSVFQVGNGSTDGNDAFHDKPAPFNTDSQVVDLNGGTTWLGDQEWPLSGQFKNPKSKQAPIVRFLDKEYPHC